MHKKVMVKFADNFLTGNYVKRRLDVYKFLSGRNADEPFGPSTPQQF